MNIGDPRPNSSRSVLKSNATSQGVAITMANQKEELYSSASYDGCPLQTIPVEDEEEHLQPASVFAEDLGPLEFARLHGLCEDFTTTRPLELCAISLKLENIVQELEDPPGGFHLDPSIHFYHPEKLEMPKEVQAFMQSTLNPPNNSFLEAIPVKKPYSKFLKVEVPLLTTDNELDVLHFGQRAVPNLHDMIFPHEDIQKENDEGLEWPSAYLDLPQNYQQKIEEDKFEADKSASKYLLSVIRCTSVEEEMDALFGSEMTYSKVDQ
jgi:hypothetical protein